MPQPTIQLSDSDPSVFSLLSSRCSQATFATSWDRAGLELGLRYYFYPNNKRVHDLQTLIFLIIYISGLSIQYFTHCILVTSWWTNACRNSAIPSSWFKGCTHPYWAQHQHSWGNALQIFVAGSETAEVKSAGDLQIGFLVTEAWSGRTLHWPIIINCKRTFQGKVW